MNLSFFLAKFFGIYLVVMGAYWVFQQDRLQRVAKDLFASPALVALTGTYSLLFGILILIVHPIFTWDFRIVITLLFGILPIVRGLGRLFLVDKETTSMKRMMNGNTRVFIGVFMLLIGAFLSYIGFRD